MRKSKSVLLIMLIVVMLLLGINATPKTVQLVTLQYPPYEFEDNNKEIKGVVVEIVKETFKRMGLSVEIHLYPFARSIKMIELGEADAIFTAYKTPEREVFSDYSNEVLMPQIVSLFVRKDSTIQFDGDLSKLSKYSIGKVQSVSYGDRFDNAFKNGVLAKVEEVGVGEQNFQKLVASRIDIVVNNKYGAIDIINTMKISKQVKELTPEVQSVPSFIAFSKKRDLAKLRDRFDETLRAIKKDGTYDKIITEYFREK